MTMRMAVARANVDHPDGSRLEKVTAETRNGKLTVRDGMRVVLTTDATAVKALPGRKWEVSTPEGVFTVARAAGCGCGRG